MTFSACDSHPFVYKFEPTRPAPLFLHCVNKNFILIVMKTILLAFYAHSLPCSVLEESIVDGDFLEKILGQLLRNTVLNTLGFDQL